MRLSVEVKKLAVTLGQRQILNDLDLDVGSGEFVVLLGPSGCGKSTLLNAIAGLLDTASGEVWIEGRDVTHIGPGERGIGMVFQSYALYPRMTVASNLGFGLKVAGTHKREIAERVSKVAELLHLTPLLTRRPAALSGGQRQRVAIGRALVRNAGVFLFDEPLSNLDAQLRAELRVEIKRLHQSLGSTMIYVTHDQVEAMTLADRIVVMRNGLIQQVGSPAEIYESPANRFVAEFIGSPPMNFIEARLGGSRKILSFSAGSVDLEHYPLPPEIGNQDVDLGIRPEHIRFVADSEGGYIGVVELIERTGADITVWTRLDQKPLAIRASAQRPVTMGDTIWFSFEARNISLFNRQDGKRI